MEHPLAAYSCGKGVFLTKKHYDIMLGDQSIGTAEVLREGLYYRFRCRCRLSGKVMYQLKAVCADKESCLGVCIPIEDEFGVDTKLAVKKLGEGDFSFYAVPRHLDMKGIFAPIRADEPFMHIENLQGSHLEYHNGEPGIWFNG